MLKTLFFTFFIAILLLGCSDHNLSLPISSEDTKKVNDVLFQINSDAPLDNVKDIVVSKDKKFIVVCSDDKTIKKYDVKTGKLIQEFLWEIGKEHEGSFYAIALSNNNKYLAAAGFGRNESHTGDIKIFDFETGKIIKNLIGHKDSVFDLSFSEDDKYLVSGSSDKKVILWEMQNFIELKKINTHDKSVNTVKIIKSDNDYKILSSSDNLISIYSIKENAEIERYTTKGWKINSFDTNGKIIVVCQGLHLIILDLNFTNIRTYIGASQFQTIKFDPTGEYFATGSLRSNSLMRMALKDSYLAESYKLDKDDIIKVFGVKYNYSVVAAFDEKNMTNISALAFIDNENLISASLPNFQITSRNINTNKIALNLSANQNIINSIGLQQKNLGYGYINKQERSMWKSRHYADDESDKKYRKQKINYSKNSINLNKIFYEAKNIRLDNAIVEDNESRIAQSAKTDGIFYLSSKDNALYLNNHNDQFKKYIQNHNDIFCYTLYEGLVVIGSEFGQISVFNFNDSEKGYKVADLKSHRGSVTSLGIDNNFLVSVGSENIINIWDLSKLKNKKIKELSPLVSIFIDKENEFVIWTEEGYFTVSSPKALKYITWHMNRGYDKEAYRYDLSKFYDVFFRPDLVKLKLEGKDINPYTGGLTIQEALKNPPPSVTLTEVKDSIDHAINPNRGDLNIKTKQSKIKVRFNILDEGGGIGVIRIYQEGKLIKTIGNDMIKKVTADADVKSDQQEFEKSRKTEVALAKSVNKEDLTFDDRIGATERESTKNRSGNYEVDVDLKKGQNTISIEAFNSTNTITSFQSSVQINADIPKQLSKLYAVVVGVNQFDAPFVPNLKYAVNDAKSISEEIKKTKKKIYDDVDVIYLADKEATRKNIEEAFEKIQQKASVNDTVVFYMSSHGISANGTFYLFPSNNTNSKEFIDFSELFKMSSQTKALSQIFLVDACQSGGALDIASSVYDSRASVLARSAGIHLLSASTSGTSAFENDSAQHGAFTYQILSALEDRKNDVNKDGFISIIEISEELKRRQQDNVLKDQFPVIRNVGNDVMLEKY